MEARTGLVIGGVTAVAASIAVVTAVALANTMALADSPGTSLASEHVVVPAATSPSPSPSPSATPAVTPAALVPPADAEVAEAPAPLVVAQPPAADGSRPTANAPAAPDRAQPAAPADIEPVIAAAKAAGSWEELRSWAAAHGWTTARTDALVSRLERELAEKSEVAERPVQTQSDGQQNLVAPVEQQKSSADRRSNGPDRPAHAGGNVGNGNGADHDAKKDQSRNSPDKRD
ncbi:hypothetical protein Q9R08_18025 [Microbacterium sp. QXD-8]|uniref:Uncharacterized protein n=1 Tax=Microbacterium psychrotolerans TaxID=3068321 RepID=A0ABU0Z5M8_9MICO|nr:hypothetical protein [Microbacterium sp. QXD-8]MDQ7879895.1 hypothetical protein [Microbacterium sp. QXD-8]